MFTHLLLHEIFDIIRETNFAKLSDLVWKDYYLGKLLKDTWQPVMEINTTDIHYWLNWRVLLCAIWVLSSIVLASFLIWRYEDHHHNEEESEQHKPLYEDELWKPCLKQIHPTWLLAFRIFSFAILFALLLVNIGSGGGQIFYFYTQWTFTLVLIYFGFASWHSIHGSYLLLKKTANVNRIRLDTEQGNYPASSLGDSNSNHTTGNSNHQCAQYKRQIAQFGGYFSVILYQMTAGAVILTDSVFWFILFPLLSEKGHRLTCVMVMMHSVNVIFLIGDIALNSLQFPWFRIAYFILWTAMYVIFQWIIHACISIRWPYSFLDLSSPYAPLWYIGVGLMHIPCYAFIVFIVRIKHKLYSRWFSQYS